jgi:hypothetical protein
MSADNLADRLAQPFDPTEIRWKPAAVSGNRALAIAFVDARTIMQRLDDVLGITGWSDAYKFLPDGSCVCKLSCCIAGHWLSKMDVGGPSEQEDEGDRRKAAASDSLKRAAVKWGLARYIYRLPRVWVPYDPKTKILTPPELPVWALPYVSPRDAAALLALIQQTGTDPERFCEHYQIDTPERLPAVKYQEALAKLQSKRPSNGGSKAPAAGAGKQPVVTP